MDTDLTSTYLISRPPFRVTCMGRVPRSEAERWLDEHPHWFGKEDGQAAPGRVQFVPLSVGEAVVKREEVSVARSLRYALRGRPARALRSFRLAMALQAAGVATAAPLALIERRDGGLVRSSWLVLETINAPDLRRLMLRELKTPSADFPRLKKGILAAVAVEVAKLHDAGFRQRDLKASNLLVEVTDARTIGVHLVDLDGVTRLSAGRVPPRVRVRDLARLLVSLRALPSSTEGETGHEIGAEDWEFFVRRYLEWRQGGTADVGAQAKYLRETKRWAERKEGRNRRRRRPLT